MLTIGIHYLSDVASLDMRGKFIKGQGGFQLQMLVDKVLLAGTRNLLLNLTEVPIIDSMGIGEIVRAYNKVKEAGGTMKLVGLTDRVYGALKITRLLDLITSFKTEEEALESFGLEKGKAKKATKGRKRKVAKPEAGEETAAEEPASGEEG